MRARTRMRTPRATPKRHTFLATHSCAPSGRLRAAAVSFSLLCCSGCCVQQRPSFRRRIAGCAVPRSPVIVAAGDVSCAAALPLPAPFAAMTDAPDYTFKTIIIGESNAGKSSLLQARTHLRACWLARPRVTSRRRLASPAGCAGAVAGAVHAAAAARQQAHAIVRSPSSPRACCPRSTL